MESCKDMAQHGKRLNADSYKIEKGKGPRSSAVKMKIRAKKQTAKVKNDGISRKIKDLRRGVEALLKQKFVKNVVQDLTSGGIDWQREKWQSGLGSKFIHQGEKNAVKYRAEVLDYEEAHRKLNEQLTAMRAFFIL